MGVSDGAEEEKKKVWEKQINNNNNKGNVLWLDGVFKQQLV